MPLFSVIMVHYQGTVPREIYLRGVNSVLAQTCKDYELLVYHDGPLLDRDAPTPVAIRATHRRFNDFGHSLRAKGIAEATGDYLLHLNADNLIYPQALETIAAEIARPPRVFDRSGNAGDLDNIVVFPIVMHDYQRVHGHLVRLPAGSGASMIFTGNPPVVGSIDCMQVVMKRSLWLVEGGWRDKTAASDASMYQTFCAKYGYRAVSPVLGEHF